MLRYRTFLWDIPRCIYRLSSSNGTGPKDCPSSSEDKPKAASDICCPVEVSCELAKDSILRLFNLRGPIDTIDPNEILMSKYAVCRRDYFLSSKISELDYVDLSPTTFVPREQLENRTVFIYKSYKHVMQQGTEGIETWYTEWDTRERWENPLMGWASTGDPVSNLKIPFISQENAERWCTRNGWKHQVLPPREPKPMPPKSYAQNFSWNRRHRVSTK